MTRGCTDDFSFTFDFELSLISKLKCTFKQAGGYVETIEKSLSDFTQDATNKKISITLTQAETLRFKPGDNPVTIQIKILFTDGSAGATTVMSVPVNDEQYGEVLS